jgi:broad specificity phosphatase PhoE
VPVLVVRHAHALARSEWPEEDLLRPLSRRGERQSRLLVHRLLAQKPSRVISSPYRRCQDTVHLTAGAAGLAVEVDERLAEGEGRRAVDLLRAVGRDGDNAVLCSHGDVIPEILATLADEDRVDLGPAPRVEKASVWVLDGEGGRFTSASYSRPPKT